MGLGLALVDRIVRILGGRVAIRSEVGGEFRVDLSFPAAS